MKARVKQFEKGKPKILKEFKTLKEAISFAISQKRKYRIKTRVEKGLGWSVEKKTSKGWKSTSTYYS